MDAELHTGPWNGNEFHAQAVYEGALSGGARNFGLAVATREPQSGDTGKRKERRVFMAIISAISTLV